MSPVSNSGGAAIDLPVMTPSESEQRMFHMKLLTIADEERRRIGQELHDVMGQELAGLAFISDALLEALREIATPEAKLAETLKSRIKRMLNLVRTEAWGLIPVEIDAKEFVTELSRLASHISERFAVDCQFICETPILATNNLIATNLYRIAQEAVTNSIKHGSASHICVRLGQSKSQLCLRIQDDGLGMRKQPSASGGMGLQIMRFRAGIINATLDVEQIDTGGVCVTCLVRRKGQ